MSHFTDVITDIFRRGVAISTLSIVKSPEDIFRSYLQIISSDYIFRLYLQIDVDYGFCGFWSTMPRNGLTLSINRQFIVKKKMNANTNYQKAGRIFDAQVSIFMFRMMQHSRKLHKSNIDNGARKRMNPHKK